MDIEVGKNQQNHVTRHTVDKIIHIEARANSTSDPFAGFVSPCNENSFGEVLHYCEVIYEMFHILNCGFEIK